MEHARSTLATAAVLLTSLVVASHVLYPRDDAAETPTQPRIVAAAQAAWVEPPMRPLPRALPPLTEAALVPAPDAVTASEMPLKALMRTAAAQPDAGRRAEQVRRRRMAQAVSVRPKPVIQAEPAAIASTAIPEASASRIDPIGDIMRGLGFGGQG